MAHCRFALLALALACSGPGATDTATTSSAGETGSTDGMSSTSASMSTSASASTSTSESTSASTSTTDASASAVTTGCNFLCSPDGPMPPVECDLFDDPCPEGQKCTIYANDGGTLWNATKCVPVVPNPDPVDAPCSAEGSGLSGIDSCERGAFCWSVDPKTMTGYCIAFCTGSEDQCWEDPASCCAHGYTCVQSRSGIINVCLPQCDPLDPYCEGAGEGCYPVDDGFQCVPDLSGDLGASGDPCEFPNACDPMTFCGDPGAFPGCDMNAAGCCIPFCSLKAPACPEGTTCAPWYAPGEAPAPYVDLGACVIPG